MKIRNGFVSNSSTSSFIVLYKKMKRDKTPLLTTDQLKALKKAGFTYINSANPYDVGLRISDRIYSKSLKNYDGFDIICLSLDVTCNQDDTIYLLLTNKIPFIALCHYDTELVFWDGSTDYFTIELNPVDSCIRKLCSDPDISNPDISNSYNKTKHDIKEWLNKYKFIYE